eukprot:TRINITY_DN4739_c0_g1_i2.p1 TRINITY_DN4739_c0_g1~~TRINITY_DN4739_c0_g1_i2.p1  ORF type:complete len:299 (-),score=67.80 TRINITY_DN4739_c0_g1_i2:99-995(-)
MLFPHTQSPPIQSKNTRHKMETAIWMSIGIVVIVLLLRSMSKPPKVPLKMRKWADFVREHGPELVQVTEDVFQVGGTMDFPMPPHRTMHIYRVPNTRDLVIFSPVAVAEKVMEQILELGQPRFVISANAGHTRDMAVFSNRFPDAILSCPTASFKHVQPDAPKPLESLETVVDDIPGMNLIPIEGLKAHFEHIVEIQQEEGPVWLICDVMSNIPVHADFPWYGKLLYSTLGVWTNGSDPRVHFFFRKLWTKDERILADWLRSQKERTDIQCLLFCHGNDIMDKENIPNAFVSAADSLK